MATIYTHITENNQKTVFLMIFFLALSIAFGWFISWWLQEPIILYIVIAIALIQSFTSFWWSDKTILFFSHAKPITANPELYNLVENLCITAGLPMPKIYLMPERQPNAFATGRDKNHASLVVTAGLLEKLERSELEGVVAHELSHIGNKDILLQSVIVVLVSVIALLSQFFLRISFFAPMRGRRDSKDSSGIIFLIFGIVAAILAPLAASLLHLAISRKREFLADASAALLTRYPEGLARALEKISLDPSPLPVANNSTAHLYIINPLRSQEAKNWLTNLFSTHPPIKERVRRLREL